MPELTEIQRHILSFIEEQIAAFGKSPTYRVIQKAFHFKSVNAVQSHLQALIKKGMLEKDPGKAHVLRLPERFRSEATGIPILGTVTAGVPIDAQEVVVGTHPVSKTLAQKGKLFALRIRGDSMTGAGIFEDDLVIVRQQSTALHGDIVVALINHESTVKTLEKKNGKMKLIAQNPKYSPIPIENESDAIQGKVIGLFRTLN